MEDFDSIRYQNALREQAFLVWLDDKHADFDTGLRINRAAYAIIDQDFVETNVDHIIDYNNHIIESRGVDFDRYIEDEFAELKRIGLTSFERIMYAISLEIFTIHNLASENRFTYDNRHIDYVRAMEPKKWPR